MKISDKVKKAAAVLLVIWFAAGILVFTAVSRTAGSWILLILAAFSVTAGIACITYRNTLKRLEKLRENEAQEDDCGDKK